MIPSAICEKYIYSLFNWDFLTKSCKEKISKSHCKNTYELKNKDGTILIIKNLSKFCKENNLSQSYFTRILKGERKTYKGWIIKILDSGQDEEYTYEESKKTDKFSGFKF